MRRHLYIYLALVVAEPAPICQSTPQAQVSRSAYEQQGTAQPRVSRSQGRGRVPAAQYSPLAAKGGYSNSHTSPLEAMVHALNPRDVNLGAIWEERRRAWLENAGANRYFWYSFGATALLVLSWFALAWMHTDRVRERWQLAEHVCRFS